MKTTASIAAIVGLAAAQASYGSSDKVVCPAVGTSGSDGRYSCNPAHTYPSGQICDLQDGCYYLRVVAPGVSASVDVPESGTASIPTYPSASVSVDIPISRTADVPVKYTTEVHKSFVTYCPEPTTLTFGQRTETVSKATTITVQCPGGCTVTRPVIVSVDIPESRTATVPAYKTPAVSHPVSSATTPVIVSVDIPESRTASVSVDVPVYRTPSVSVAVPVYRTQAPSAPAYHPGNGTQPDSPQKTSPVIYTGSATKIAGGAVGVVGLFAAFFL